MKYSEKLKDPRWQKKRLEILERDKWTCQFCDDTETELQIHHLKYFGEPWEAPPTDLITVCKCCHLIHEKVKKSYPGSSVISIRRNGELRGYIQFSVLMDYDQQNGNFILAVLFCCYENNQISDERLMSFERLHTAVSEFINKVIFNLNKTVEYPSIDRLKNSENIGETWRPIPWTKILEGTVDDLPFD